MPYTISVGFNELLRQLPPSPAEYADAALHRSSIEQCLRNNFGLNEYFRIGSYERTTSIAGYSDVDFLAVLPSDVASGVQPGTFINKVKAALQARFSQTPIRIDRQAIVIRFSSGQRAVDVVPAVHSATHGAHEVYRIVGGDSWLYTSPGTHKDYFDTVDNRCGGNMRPLARLLKAWKYYNDAPILSFHLDTLTAKSCEDGGTITYSRATKVMLSILLNRELAALQDPAGVAGLIPACTSDSNRLTALGKLRYAVDHATRAYQAEQNENVQETFQQWNLVFGYRFPSYG